MDNQNTGSNPASRPDDAGCNEAGRISLAGAWRFEIAEANARGYARELSGSIDLPGTMDDAGLGPLNTTPATLEGPRRIYNYEGPAWYQRDIEIPDAWQGKRITLFLERCRWVTQVWLDDRRIGSRDSLVSPHVYTLGVDIAPGMHRLTICVDNTLILDLGRIMCSIYGGTWSNVNGIMGRIELAATPQVWLEEVQVYPDIKNMSAKVRAQIGNTTGHAGRATLRVNEKPVLAEWDADGGAVEVDIDLPNAELWDEFSPHLTEVVVSLGEHTRTVPFGMREFAVQGTQFALNGRPLFLRGVCESHAWPLTGYPPMDVGGWQRIFRLIKSYGFNHMRFHSWCPPEAAFCAADEEGILLQPEGPQANIDAGVDAKRDAFIEAEFKRIVDTYGNHPSFCLMALGNEYEGDTDLLHRWIDMLIQRDPRHLYTTPTSMPGTSNKAFAVLGDDRGIKGDDTMRDLHEVVERNPIPVIGHEIGQWMFYPDFDEIGKWTGVMELKNFEMIRDDLKAKQLLEYAPSFVEASGKFAVRLYKEEIEVLLRTQGYGGMALLGLNDYPCQGTAIVGPLDAFWDSKGFITPEAWRQFCAETVVLARIPQRTFTADETFRAGIELAHYGPGDLVGVDMAWDIRDDEGNLIASGNSPKVTASTGKLTSFGSVEASLASTPAPCRLTFVVRLNGTGVRNDWDFWVYAEASVPQVPEGTTVCTDWAAARAALAEGRKVVLFPNSHETLKGEFLPVFWSPIESPNATPNTMGILCDPGHPLFSTFPTDCHSDWQWYDLMQNARLYSLEGTPSWYQPLLWVIDNFGRNQKLGVVFEGRVGEGQLLVCGFDLPAMAAGTAPRQLLSSLYRYVASPAFDPQYDFDEALISRWFDGRPDNNIRALGGMLRVSSVAGNSSVDFLTDGNPGSMWTPKRAGAAFPHHVIVAFPAPVEMCGLTYLPPHTLYYGWIKEYRVYLSEDGESWSAPVAQGTFDAVSARQEIHFGRNVKAQFVKLEIVSGLDPEQAIASIADLSLMLPA